MDTVNVSRVKMLLRQGVDVNIQEGVYGLSALQVAAAKMFVEIPQLLLNAGASVNIQDKIGETALLITARTNNVEVAKLLIKAKADLNLPGRDGGTPLHITGFCNSAGVAELLIEAGVDWHVAAC